MKIRSKFIVSQIALLFSMLPAISSAQNAPITTAGSASSCPGGAITIPITVTDFSQISAVSLRLDFDSTMLQYVGYNNLNPSLPGCMLNVIPVSGTQKKILVVWSQLAALSLPNGSTIVDLNFVLVGGLPTLSFNNTSNSGGDCEYANASGNSLNDIPTSTYYIDAAITNLGPAQAGPVTGAASMCLGQQGVVYSVTAIPNATSYAWAYSGSGATINNGSTNNITVDFAANATLGNLSVQGINSCGNGPLSPDFPILVAAVPVLGSISGPATVCQGQNTVTYSVATVPEAISYSWSYSGAGATISNGTTNSVSINFSANATSGNLIATGTNVCGVSGSPTSYPITVNPLPEAAGNIIGPGSVCQGQSAVGFSVAPILNATSYEWNYSGTGATISNGSTNIITIHFASNATSGNLTVTGINYCGTGAASANFPVVVNVLPTAEAGLNQSIGYGANTMLNGSATGGSGFYNWHWEPASLLGNPNSQNPTTLNLTNTVQFNLTVSDAVNGCSGSDFVIVTIIGGPLAVSATAFPETTCAGETVQLQALVGGGTGNYTYSWTSQPAGFTSSLQNPTVNPTISTQYTLVVNDGNATLSDFAGVTVNPLPPLPTTPVGPDAVDLRVITNSNYSTISSQYAESYIWEISPTSAGDISGNGINGSVVWNPNYLGLAKIKVASLNTCGQSVFSSEKITFVDNTTGLKESDLQSVIIYPNPNNGSFSIKTSNEIKRIVVSDAIGRIKYDAEKLNNYYHFELQLSDGLYLVRILLNEGWLEKKMLVKKK
jgi:hypothetical protein